MRDAVAAIDCGTNSIRLLIWGQDGEVTRQMRIVRLGEGVDSTGRFTEAALRRTREALADYVAMMREAGVARTRMVATSATRDAANREDFFRMTEDLLGQRAEVISGVEEASLSFHGAIADLDDTAGPFCVIDLGGGSTEFIVGDRSGIRGAHSAQMGCVRLTERILHSVPPTYAEVAQAREYVRDRLQEVLNDVPLGQTHTLVGVAGTFTTICALAQGLSEYDATRIHGTELDFGEVRAVTQRLNSQTPEERRQSPVMHPGRADVIGGGSVVVEEILRCLGNEAGVDTLRISEHDILDGIVQGLLA